MSVPPLFSSKYVLSLITSSDGETRHPSPVICLLHGALIKHGNVSNIVLFYGLKMSLTILPIFTYVWVKRNFSTILKYFFFLITKGRRKTEVV